MEKKYGTSKLYTLCKFDLKDLFDKVISPLKYTLDQIGYWIDRSFEKFIWVRNVVNGNALRFKDETGVEKWIPEYIYIKEIYPFMTEPYIANFSFLFYIAKKEGCTITPYKDKDPEYKNRNYIKISFKNDFIISNELDCLHQFIVKVKNKKNQEEYKNKLLTEAYEHVMSDENMESRLTDVYEHTRQKKIKKGDLK